MMDISGYASISLYPTFSESTMAHWFFFILCLVLFISCCHDVVAWTPSAWEKSSPISFIINNKNNHEYGFSRPRRPVRCGSVLDLSIGAGKSDEGSPSNYHVDEENRVVDMGGGKEGVIPEPAPGVRAYPQQTPHSGRHFSPSHAAFKGRNRLWQGLRRRRRFTEGWYYRLTIPEKNVSFAIILSIEDPGHNPPSKLRLACIQVIGPHDEYLVQGDRNDSLFWAWRHQQGLGCTFETKTPNNSKHERQQQQKETATPQTALSRDEWYRTGMCCTW